MVSSIGSGGFSASAIAQQRQQIFQRADTNGDGKVDASELENDLKSNAPTDAPQGVSGSAPTSAEILSQLDSDGDGSLSEEEFAKASPPPPPPGGKFDSSTASTLLSAQEDATNALLKLFEKSDANGDGEVTEDEFTSYINDAVDDEELSASETFAKAVSQLFQSQDTNGDGVVNALDTQSSTSDNSSSSNASDTATAEAA
ncbi:EF-hand domain-containing protein [Elstera litoralis]|uniref:EF-hand domain-containing protein n=1 Tax=Elstera litoralis TaxID=552518 RepID=UPI000699156F|nr:EF-hand domain-containing protein [Elstera litoralis]